MTKTGWSCLSDGHADSGQSYGYWRGPTWPALGGWEPRRSNACEACACRSQCGDTDASISALFPALFTIRQIPDSVSGLPFFRTPDPRRRPYPASAAIASTRIRAIRWTASCAFPQYRDLSTVPGCLHILPEQLGQFAPAGHPTHIRSAPETRGSGGCLG
jgi:hypothetical protein